VCGESAAETPGLAHPGIAPRIAAWPPVEQLPGRCALQPGLEAPRGLAAPFRDLLRASASRRMSANSVGSAGSGSSRPMKGVDFRSATARRSQMRRSFPPSACGDPLWLCRSAPPGIPDSRSRSTANCVGGTPSGSVQWMAGPSRVMRLTRSNPHLRLRPGLPAVERGTAVAVAKIVAGSSAQTPWQMRLTGRALVSNPELTPNEAADVPVALSHSLTATYWARAACQPSRVLS
jgi:hypothetical protein